MLFLVLCALLAVVVTTGAAWLIGRLQPSMDRTTQTVLAAASFPLLSFLLFVVATIMTLAGEQPAEPGGTVGMVVFALAFFLVYAVLVGLFIGVPTAVFAVRQMRR